MAGPLPVKRGKAGKLLGVCSYRMTISTRRSGVGTVSFQNQNILAPLPAHTDPDAFVVNEGVGK